MSTTTESILRPVKAKQSVFVELGTLYCRKFQLLSTKLLDEQFDRSASIAATEAGSWSGFVALVAILDPHSDTACELPLMPLQSDDKVPFGYSLAIDLRAESEIYTALAPAIVSHASTRLQCDITVYEMIQTTNHLRRRDRILQHRHRERHSTAGAVSFELEDVCLNRVNASDTVYPRTKATMLAVNVRREAMSGFYPDVLLRNSSWTLAREPRLLRWPSIKRSRGEADARPPNLDLEQSNFYHIALIRDAQKEEEEEEKEEATDEGAAAQTKSLTPDSKVSKPQVRGYNLSTAIACATQVGSGILAVT